MSISTQLQQRSNNTCELCGATNNLQSYTVPPKTDDISDNQVALCGKCMDSITQSDYSDTNHWRSLTGSIWSETPAVQALSYKILSKLKSEDWAQETMDSVFLDEAIIDWANAEDAMAEGKVVHKDSNGTILENGDSVLLIQNLNVKGANFIAPKGTIVRKIRLVPDNAEQIEGKVNGATIVLLTKYLKKSV